MVVAFSPGAEALLGIRTSEAEGQPATEAFRRVPELARHLADASATEPAARTEYLPSVGRWLSVRIMPSGRQLLVILGEDTTAALVESSRGLAAAAGDFGYSYRAGSGELRPEWFSEGFGRVTGLRAREIRNLESWIARLLPEDQQRYREALARGADRPFELEYRILVSGGATRWLLDRVSPSFDEGGQLIRVQGVAVDITERKEEEASLAATRDALRTLFESLPLALVGLDRDDLVTHWNPAAERLFGWSAEEILHAPYPLVTEETREEHRLVLQDAFQGGKGFSGLETKRRRKDGSLVDVAVWTAAIPEINGRPPSAVGVFLDLSERKKLEDQLYQSQKMEAVGRLAGGIAHDFNNLMTVVTGHAAMLIEDGKLGEAERAAMAEIGEAGEKASLLTRQLLAFSRRQVLQPRVISMNEAITDMERLLRRVIGEEVELRTTLDGQVGFTRVDPVQFQQVVMNLVVNARDAMSNGGQIQVRTVGRRIGPELAAQFPYPVRTGEYVVLEVQDEGSGITESVRARIFEPFFTTKTQGKGTGLGLSTVYGIVKQSGGYIWVDSEVGGGTTFSVYLPRVQAPINEPSVGAENPGEQVRQPGGTILLVEDETAVRSLVRRVLESEGYTILEAENGDQAVALSAAHEGPIDLLLSDVVMPGRRGPEVFHELSRIRPGLVAVFMSGYSEEVLDMDEFVSAEVSFLSKPFTPRTLRKTIATAMGAGGPPGLPESAAPREHGVETMLKRLEAEAAMAGRGEAARKLSRAGELCVRAGQRERALRFLGRAVDAFLGAGLDREAERVCGRILDIAPSVVRARRTLALLAIGRGDIQASIERVGDYVRAAMEARQSELAVKQLRIMSGLSHDRELQDFVAQELDLLGGHALVRTDEAASRGEDSEATDWNRAVHAALTPPSPHIH